MKLLLFVFSLISTTWILFGNAQRHQPLVPHALPLPPPPPAHSPFSYHLPSGVELVVGDYRSTFRCEGRIYGYYADQDNNCQIFHVCIPFVDEQGNDVPTMYSFFCGNQTVFDQSHLVCAHPSDALPCTEAQHFFNVNDNFGREDVPFLQK